MGKSVDLAGSFRFQLDEQKKGILEEYPKNGIFGDEIMLPGTTALAKKGKLNEEKAAGYLTEEYKFCGYAWYERDVVLSEADSRENIFLTLERSRITTVWVDGEKVGTQERFCAPHIYDLSSYVKGRSFRLTILVCNVDYKIPGGHMTSPDTQTNWNGILGKIALDVYHITKIDEIQAYPNLEKKKVDISLSIRNFSEKRTAELTFFLMEKKNSGKVVAQQEKELVLQAGQNRIEVTLPVSEEVVGWNEYHPSLYEIRTAVKTGGDTEQKCCTIGFRSQKTADGKFYLNNQEIMLRGKHEGLVFPLTGFAPMEKEKWCEVFTTAKNYGINHYRFHTCCPPEAAFAAADEMGIYLEPELPFWGTIYGEEEEGYDRVRQEFLEAEGYAILKAFGNHPSFLLFSLGNELWGNKQMLQKMLRAYKRADSRHWYVEGSNNFQFTPLILPEDDFYCGVRFSENRLFRGSYASCDAPQGHIQVCEPDNAYCFDENIRPAQRSQETGEEKDSTPGKNATIQIQYQTGVKEVEASGEAELFTTLPVVSHEVGQYAFYPDFTEIEKYTGVLKAENFKLFKKRLEKKGMEGLAGAFFWATGKLAVDCYKRELEAAFRSRELAGFQLLDLADFPGQGTALVGILNAFLENKGLVEAAEWKRSCSDRVIMLSFPKYVYAAGEDFFAELLLSYMAEEKIKDTVLRVSIKEDTGEEQVVLEKEIKELERSRLQSLGKLSFKLPVVEQSKKITVTVNLVGTKIENVYEIYVFPKQNISEAGAVVVTDRPDEAQAALEKGACVCYFNDAKKEDRTIESAYCTDFWCYSMFRSISESVKKPLPVGTMGLLIKKEHPALAEFVTEGYATPQWWKLTEGSEASVLDAWKEITPIVQIIDNVERNHKIGLIYEARVGAGRLLVCRRNLMKQRSLETDCLYNSLVHYCASSAFAPSFSFTPQEVAELL